MSGVVMFLRLKNGDDIVSECYEYDSDQGKYFVLINPLKAVYMSSEHGRAFLQVAFMPWVYQKISKSQEFSIYASEVLLVQEVSDYMEHEQLARGLIDSVIGPKGLIFEKTVMEVVGEGTP